MTVIQSDRRILTGLKTTSQIAGMFVALVGCAVLVGWLVDNQTLKSILPEWVAMKPNTALGFVLSGLTLNFLKSTGKLKRRVAQGFALAVTVLGLLTISEYIFGCNLGIDQLLFLDNLAIATSAPGRMAPVTAFNFVLIGSALWLSTSRTLRYQQLVQLLALITALTSLQVIISYIYGVKPLFGLAAFTHTAIHTAVTFIALSLGTLFVAPSEGWMSLVVSNSAGGITARVLLPAAIAIPFGLGWLRVLGERVELFDTAFGLSLHVIGNVVAFMGLIWYCAKRLLGGISTDITELRQAELEQRQSLKNLAEIKFALDQSSIVVITNGKGIITYVNDKFCELSKYSREELIGQNHRIINSSYHSKAFFKQMWAKISTGQVWQGEIKNRAKDNTFYWVATTIVPFLDAAGKPYQYIAIRSDITNCKQVEYALQEQAQLLDLVYEAIFVRDANDTIAYWNRSAEELYGWTSPEAIGKIPHSLLQTQFSPPYLNFDDILHQQGHWEGELTHTRRDGSQVIVESRQVLMQDAEGQVKGVLEVNRDITERKRAEEQLLQNAFYDALTGLPNRALFMERLKHALEQAKRQQDYLFAVLFLDLDRFKVINDSLGHLIGDKFLLTIADRVRVCIRSMDIVARFGGDEFTILLEGIQNVTDAIKVVERIQQQLALPLELDGQEVFTTASIGIALSSTVDYDQPENLLRDADAAMYRAKALGKARYELFNPEMYADALDRLQLETDLRRAIERQEFRVYYQPIVSLTSGRISSFEALLRWQHPERGLVSPADFIPIAEETGLIVEIGYWVLHEACRQMQAWRVSHPTNSPNKISVNLSVKQFYQSDLIKQIEQILDSTGLDAGSLVLEITESAIVENSDEAIAQLSQLRDLGIELSIDDFGTGYSSLGRLYSFPISVLKIDRSFVSPMDADSRNLEIIEIIVTLAHKLNVDVTSEGVETKEQLALMRKLNCEYGQGYFFSAPVDSSAATGLIATNPQW